EGRQSKIGLRRNRSSLTGDLRRDSLRELAQRAIVDQQGPFRLPQHIDETGRNNQSLCIYYPLSARTVYLSERCNTISANSQIAGDPWISRAIDNPSVPDHHVVVCRAFRLRFCLCLQGRV